MDIHHDIFLGGGGGKKEFRRTLRAEIHSFSPPPLYRILIYAPAHVFLFFDPILHILLYFTYLTLSFIYSCIPLIQPYPSNTPVFLLFNPILHLLLYSSYSNPLIFIYFCIPLIQPYPSYSPVLFHFQPYPSYTHIPLFIPILYILLYSSYSTLSSITHVSSIGLINPIFHIPLYFSYF